MFLKNGISILKRSGFTSERILLWDLELLKSTFLLAFKFTIAPIPASAMMGLVICF
jgi:hypothetical protein